MLGPGPLVDFLPLPALLRGDPLLLSDPGLVLGVELQRQTCLDYGLDCGFLRLLFLYKDEN